MVINSTISKNTQKNMQKIRNLILHLKHVSYKPDSTVSINAKGFLKQMGFQFVLKNVNAQTLLNIQW